MIVIDLIEYLYVAILALLEATLEYMFIELTFLETGSAVSAGGSCFGA